MLSVPDLEEKVEALERRLKALEDWHATQPPATASISPDQKDSS